VESKCPHINLRVTSFDLMHYRIETKNKLKKLSFSES